MSAKIKILMGSIDGGFRAETAGLAVILFAVAVSSCSKMPPLFRVSDIFTTLTLGRSTSGMVGRV